MPDDKKTTTQTAAFYIDWLRRIHFFYVLWSLLGGQVLRAALHTWIPSIGVWISPLWLLASCLIFWGLSEWAQSKAEEQTTIAQNANDATNQASTITPGIPALSDLLGEKSTIGNFDAKQFFALSYYSPVTAEIEKIIKLIAKQHSPSDPEAFYARFIGIGWVAYQHDVSWYTIFGSQLSALNDMNAHGLLPINALKKYYDIASTEYPNLYKDYTFDQWYGYLKGRMLIADYPSQMVELSHNGKDFLKYLAHAARDTRNRRN